MEIEFDLNKSVEENAGTYFNLAKKAKKKLKGAQEALERSRQELERLKQQEGKFLQEYEQKQQKKENERKQEWYEKFHWFISSEDFLCIGGRDATSNEMVIKKHLDKDDLVLHTDMAGSPFFVIKDGQKAGEETIKEAAQAVGVYSRAWKLGHATADVFYVKPEQVSKEAQSGEYMSKGSFMVRGKTNYLHPKLEYALGLVDEQIIGGPLAAVKSKISHYIIVVPGKEKKSSLAKKIKAKLKGGDLDEIIKFLPAGGGEIKK
ncbi:MAG TPA: NFACT RNA binding domain-containing protein [Candidatus Nanoarchaeia archaeon]|nr:NFACT RNA binding domain-containing protein [Candidatus Nanoarchaeia archaeon]